MEGEKRRRKSEEGTKYQQARLLGLCDLFSDSIPDCFCQELTIVFATDDFAAEMGPVISPSTKDASREFGEGSAESIVDNLERDTREKSGSWDGGRRCKPVTDFRKMKGVYTDSQNFLQTCTSAEKFRTALRVMWLLLCTGRVADLRVLS